MQTDRRGIAIAVCVVFLIVGLGFLAVGIRSVLNGEPLGGLITLRLMPLLLGVLLLVILFRDPFRRSRSGDPETLAKGHHLTFAVGEDPAHQVDIRWDQTWGWLTATVDGQLVYRTLQTLTLRTVKSIEFEVGGDRHRVRVEKRRPVTFSFAREQSLTAFVDGQPAEGTSAVSKTPS